MKKTIVLLSTFSILLFGSAISYGQHTVSDEARRHFDRGMAAAELAKAPEDYKVAIEEFKQSALLAPEWPDVFYNLGLVQEKAGQFKDAANSLKSYLRLVPDAADSDIVKSLINKLEFKAEQVLSISDIIDILVSGFAMEQGGWKYTPTVKTDGRECRRLWAELYFQREGVNNVKVLESTRYYQSVKDHFQILNITGPALKYITTINVCDESANNEEGGCDSVIENEVEVVSKRLIKVNQRVIRGGAGAGVATGDRFSATFQK